MMKQLIASDFMKLKRKGIWFLTFLGPFGVVAMQMVNYGVRKDYLLSRDDDHWGYYLSNLNSFTGMAIVLGITILTSFMASIENETNAWKQLIALPVSKFGVYLSKFTVLMILLFLSSTALMIFGLAYGMSLQLDGSIPIWDLAGYSFYPFLAALPILALQLWVSAVSINQGIPITLGIIGVILTYMSYSLPDWFIWKWPTLINAVNEPLINAGLGLGFGLLLYVIGMVDFARRDVK